MALSKKIEISGKSYVTSEFGNIDNGDAVIPLNAYIKVSQVVSDKSTAFATVVFSSGQHTFSKSYKVPMSVENNAPNFIKQVYDHLKMLPEFAGAADC